MEKIWIESLNLNEQDLVIDFQICMNFQILRGKMADEGGIGNGVSAKMNIIFIQNCEILMEKIVEQYEY